MAISTTKPPAPFLQRRLTFQPHSSRYRHSYRGNAVRPTERRQIAHLTRSAHENDRPYRGGSTMCISQPTSGYRVDIGTAPTERRRELLWSWRRRCNLLQSWQKKNWRRVKAKNRLFCSVLFCSRQPGTRRRGVAWLGSNALSWWRQIRTDNSPIVGRLEARCRCQTGTRPRRSSPVASAFKPSALKSGSRRWTRSGRGTVAVQ